jgi:hypothetical protein
MTVCAPVSSRRVITFALADFAALLGVPDGQRVVKADVRAGEVTVTILDWPAGDDGSLPPKVLVEDAGQRRHHAECARCGRVKAIRRAGLCTGCAKHGTDGYAITRADRMGDYAAARAEGLPVLGAAARAGVTDRTGWRYERDLAGAGKASWRAAA